MLVYAGSFERRGESAGQHTFHESDSETESGITEAFTTALEFSEEGQSFAGATNIPDCHSFFTGKWVILGHELMDVMSVGGGVAESCCCLRVLGVRWQVEHFEPAHKF